MRSLATATTVFALLLAGCGGDDNDVTSAADTSASEPAQAAPVETAAVETDAGTADEAAAEGPASKEDQAAIRETLVTWLLEGPCELMSDKFLEEQAVFGDTRAERCDFFSKSFAKPQYGEDDIVTSDFKVGGEKGSAVISDHISNVETTFNVVRADGKWVIDGTD